ncbi:OTU family cysteine protease [Toxoplasma gondii GT1]|uniref:OTU family cysteine protease n=2 Tax=Toxoplasma gondii TaxID=5811 RepID=S7ULT2_TOXGG|nr:OTU family cysteine protease [Toxoplasma gondii GT1]KAF4639841.1 OTU family cysteine protease [Toxoplasma gondii]
MLAAKRVAVTPRRPAPSPFRTGAEREARRKNEMDLQKEDKSAEYRRKRELRARKRRRRKRSDMFGDIQLIVFATSALLIFTVYVAFLYREMKAEMRLFVRRPSSNPIETPHVMSGGHPADTNAGKRRTKDIPGKSPAIWPGTSLGKPSDTKKFRDYLETDGGDEVETNSRDTPVPPQTNPGRTVKAPTGSPKRVKSPGEIEGDGSSREEDEEAPYTFREDPTIFPYRSSLKEHGKKQVGGSPYGRHTVKAVPDTPPSRGTLRDGDILEDEKEMPFYGFGRDPVIFPYRSSLKKHGKKQVVGSPTGEQTAKATPDEKLIHAETISSDTRDTTVGKSEQTRTEREPKKALEPLKDATDEQGASLLKAPRKRRDDQGSPAGKIPFIPPNVQQLGFSESSMQWRREAAAALGIPESDINDRPLITSSPLLGKPAAVYRVGGDGSCFFRALSYAVTGSEDFASTIRRRIVSFIFDENPDLTSEHVLPTADIQAELRRATGSSGLFRLRAALWLGSTPVQNMTREQLLLAYKNYMSNAGTFATHREVEAAAKLLNSRICVFVPGRPGTPQRDAWEIHSPKGFDDDLTENMPAVYLVNTGLVHFDVVTAVLTPTKMESVR